MEIPPVAVKGLNPVFRVEVLEARLAGRLLAGKALGEF
jgi:hypothetical protein